MLHLARPRRGGHDLSLLESTSRPFHRTRVAAPTAIATVLATLVAACSGDNTPTSPTSTTTTTVSTAATVTEDFIGTLPVGASRFYSVSIAETGTVSVLYSSASGTGVPGTVWLGLGLGTPSGEDCATTNNVNTPPGSGAQITGTYPPGVYCVKVSDIGNLFAPVAFDVSITHP